MDELLARLADWRPFSALVVGDFILDELVYGEAERLSPDAPVPVLLVRKREFRPGGAANVCMDLAALGGRVTALGVTGGDGAGAQLRASLAKEGIACDGLVEDASRPTTLKQNLIGLAQARHPQKMFRVDEESREPLSDAASARLLRIAEDRIANVDLVVIEDYAKGVCGPEVCREVIAMAKRKGKPVFVDPALRADPAKYAGATAITPNRTEAEAATGMRTASDSADSAHNEALARTLLDRLGLECVVLTLDRHGAMVLERDKRPVTVPTQARQVYDVSGAGDMFLAGLAAARANGCNWADAVRFANAAAGLEVEVFGVQPIPFPQVRDSVLRLAGAANPGKLRSWEQARAECAEARRRGGRVVFTNGCFDVLHSGHVAMLEKAAAEGDFLVVGLNSDDSVRRLKGPSRPVNGEADRARVLGALGCVGAVVVFGEDTPQELIETITPDVLVKGADYTKDRVVGAAFVESYGGRVALIDLVPGKSTTGTIEKMQGVR
ncbi:MAG TPA: D-glycero-beta-D-manno-heptose 1-phosphate adenylyltransferase [Phycisphaerales bacterium]|nr:D-glycero-beta-D-manno-heptose 1-phosphate adenylyltransferase [Phycisphaerales bacterium]